MSKTTVRGPILAIDLGAKRVGLSVSDELSVSIRRLDPLPRTNWKQLLRDVANVVQEFDAQTIVIGLPLRLDGTEGDAATEARRLAKNFARSLTVPVFLQDERLTSADAEETLRISGKSREAIAELVDSESAAIILRDFLADDAPRLAIRDAAAFTRQPRRSRGS